MTPPDPRYILAIDTATDQAGVGLLAGEDVCSELWWQAAGNHSRQLQGAIQELLHLNRLNVSQIGGIVVAAGPGSFNGLRVGISAGKGLAFGLGVPLAGISTLHAIGLQASSAARRVWALLPAGRRELYRGQFGGRGTHWQPAGEADRLSIETAAEQYSSEVLLAGSGSELLAGRLAELGRAARLPPACDRPRRPGYLAELGRRYFAAGGKDQVDDLEPLYMRKSSAEENRPKARGD